MQLKIGDVANYFRVSERTVYRWIEQRSIPVYKIQDQYRFEKSELLEWAMAKRIPVSRDFFSDPEHESGPLPAVADVLRGGGIFYRLEALDKMSALHQLVELMRLPEMVDRSQVLELLLAREAMASTGVGEGIAIPHIRNPVLAHVTSPIMNLGFPDAPLDYGALDGKPVHCLIGLISPNAKVHLHLMSRLGFILRDEQVRNLLRQQSPRAEILSGIEEVENRLVGKMAK
jgi:PTS system nitrogen regulatory IIA component